MDVISDPRLIEEHISAAWELDGDVIVKVAKFPNFAAALAYVNAVGEIAEELDHHPDIDIRYDTVTLRCSTHYLGGITEKDFELAARIDQLDDVEAG